MDKIAIILVNYKTVECALECIESIKNQDYSNITTYVVDNDSKDNCKNIIESRWSDVVVIENSDNMGFSAANNIGIKRAIKDGAKYLMLLNCDTWIPSEYVSTLVNILKADSSIGIVSGKILYYYDKSIIWSSGGQINEYKGSSDVYGFQQKNEVSKIDLTECTFISGCCMMMPVDAFLNVGEMSEDYFLYYEDTDYCARFVKAGYRLVNTNKTEMLHKESVSTGKRSALYSYYFARNRLHFIRMNIRYPKKYLAYIYSCLWIVKKIFIGEFKTKAVALGVKDFLLGNIGKSKISFN